MRSVPTVVEFEEHFTPYHKGKNTYRPGKDGVKTPPLERPFIGWDGEGMNLLGKGRPQRYVLFGCATPDGPRYISAKNLNTRACLDLILELEEEYPDAFHISFAFGYDVNQIVKSLPKRALEILHKTGSVYLFQRMYRIEWRKGKTFTVTRYNGKSRISATIFDVFSFFTTSFVKAVRALCGDSPALEFVASGKDARNDFQWEDLTYVTEYWTKEGELLLALMARFREVVYSADLPITQWHGPGALASYVNKRNSIKDHMSDTPTAVNEASAYAYAGGRFELFKLGRYTGDVYSYDINSAYPEAIAQLPSLAGGSWHHNTDVTRIARFGVYRIRYRGSGPNRSLFPHQPGPFFYRSTKYEISYPHALEGWYWSPEAAIALVYPGAEILEGWEFYPLHSDRPYAWIQDMYNTRREWKAEGLPSELALKLCMNSLYGKMAQRVGWDKEKRRPPAWHQLEWAGWVTSYTRAKLFTLMTRIGYDRIIAVETDGIYCTATPDQLGIVGDKELGGWEVKKYEEILYLQSGFYWHRHAEEGWKSKYRGLDPGSITLDDATAYVSGLDFKANRWPSLTGTTTRFVGLGAALQSTNFRDTHCTWQERMPREMTPGAQGKRIHVPSRCRACAANESPNNALHDLVVTLPPRIGGISTPHSLPWKGNDEGATIKEPWRETQEYWEEMISA